MSIHDQIMTLMERPNGVTIGELVARGINKNTARRELNQNYTHTIERKCRATGNQSVAYAYCEWG